MDRRDFLRSTFAAAAGTLLAPSLVGAADTKPRRVMLSNCWHNTNIGDQAHAPGMIQLIEKYLPGTQVTLWPYNPLTPEVHDLLTTAFPKLTILEPGGDEQAKPMRADLAAAMRECDLIISGSGGYHGKPLRMWRTVSDKPYGAYGVSFSEVKEADLLSNAAFVYCRDTISLGVCQKAGVKCPALEFGPDSTFGMTLRNDTLADKYLASVGLEPKKFLCAIPRARYSPYPQMYNYEPSEKERQQAQANAEFATSDHALLRDLIVYWVRKTGLKVLACPEMTYHVPLSKEQLIDPLPEDVKKQVVWRDSFWLCDEAASVFARSLAVVSMDCHSPIIALVNGTPAIHLRVPSDTLKSQMFADIGLKDWVHTITNLTSEQLNQLTLAIYEQPVEAQKKVAAAMYFVHQRQAATMKVLGQALAKA